MLTFERRRNILKLLAEQPSQKVIQLAARLDVSEGTIRNDLDALANEHKLKRVRGGAVLLDSPLGVDLAHPLVQAPQVLAKQKIARWAAELVEDDDVIFLDASSTVKQMLPLLKDRRDLTILTNGLDVALMLSKQSPNSLGHHTVIVIGGLVSGLGHGQCCATGGYIGEALLDRLHIKKAFVSASGFTLPLGLMEHTIEQAQLKERVLGAAKETIVLLDATKIGDVSLIPFAQLDQVAHIFTDTDVSPELMAMLRTTGTNLTICDEKAKRFFAMPPPEIDGDSGSKHTMTIGFANQSESMPFAVEVRRGLERAASQLDGVDLIVTDNQLSGEEALRVADFLLGQPVDLVIEYQIDHAVGSQLMDKFQRAHVPVIAVDIPMIGATYFGVDNYRSGALAGAALGHWVIEHWNGHIDYLLVLEELRAGALPAARIQGQLDAFQETIDPVSPVSVDSIIRLDSGNTRSITKVRGIEALKSLPHATQIAIICFNADTAIGALAAARHLDREEHVVIVGQGGDRSVRDEIRDPASRLIGSTANMPERYGEQLLTIARRLLHGEPVPPAVYIDHVFLSADNIDQYYPL